MSSADTLKTKKRADKAARTGTKPGRAARGASRGSRTRRAWDRGNEKLLDTLPCKDRALLYRKYYYMQSTDQIARELGTTPRAVEGRLYRLKKQLRARLGGDSHG